MASTSSNNIFLLLFQGGPFATGSMVSSDRLFSFDSRTFVASLRNDRLLTQYRIIRNQIFDLLEVKSFKEISTLFDDHDRRQQITDRCHRLLGNMFGIQGNEREIVSTINSYSKVADGVIRYLKSKVLAPYSSYIEMTNEIDVISNPVELLLIVFNNRYHQKARFEAKRKLMLMGLAGSIDQRERETGVEDHFRGFLEFLNKHVWSNDLRIGELEVSYLLSHHDPERFTCQEAKVIGPKEAKTICGAKGTKLTLIKRRRFQANGRSIPIYVSIRKKPPEAKVLKLLRKGEENPAIAVDDELGLMAVLDSMAEVKLFHKHLANCAVKAGSFMTFEEVSDTLTGGRHQSSSIGSSSQTRMFKFFARMGGMRVEFIIHTNQTYLNYIYEREVSHDEYEVKRIFDSGVAELLFPREIYYLDMEDVKNRQLQLFRNQIEAF